MTTPSDGLTSINVVPHFSRLHEWIALEEGYFQDEGLEPHMLSDVMHSVSSHRGDAYGQRPQDLPFVQEQEVANSACEWGTACNAGAGMGRVVPDLYSVGRYAIFVKPDSEPHRHRADGRKPLHYLEDFGRSAAQGAYQDGACRRAWAALSGAPGRRGRGREPPRPRDSHRGS